MKKSMIFLMLIMIMSGCSLLTMNNPFYEAPAVVTETEPVDSPASLPEATDDAEYYNISYKNVFDATNDNPASYTVQDNITLKEIIRKGYTFGGWYDASSDGNKITGWNAGDCTGDVTLWARWSANTYTVKFDANGGSGSMADMQMTYETEQKLTLCLFTAPPEYKFGSWNTVAAGTGTTYNDGESVKNLAANADGVVTLYAQWIDKNTHCIQYYDSKKADNSKNPKSFKENEEIILQDVTTDGYTFDGWYEVINDVTADTSTDGWNIGERTDDVILYAYWTPKQYKINYKDQGDAIFSGLLTNLMPKTHIYGSATALVAPTRTGYDFIGWYENSDCSGSAITQLGGKVYSSGITLYAKWMAGEFAITYKDQSGDTFSGVHGSGYPKTHSYGVETTLVAPTRIGGDFVGWYNNSDCSGSALTKLGATDYTSGITLYAKWTDKWDINNDGNFVYGKKVYLKTGLKTVLSTETTFTCDIYDTDSTFNSERGSVKLSPYSLGKYYVTQQLFEKVMGVNPAVFIEAVAARESIETNTLLRPIDRVSSYDAVTFCNKLSLHLGKTPCYTVTGITDWLELEYSSIPTAKDDNWNNVTCDWSANGYRLPTECEWECATRGAVYSATTPWLYTYSGSDDIDEVAWYRDNSNNHTWEVGLKAPNTLGLYDLYGNLLNLCWDWLKGDITTSDDLYKVDGIITNPKGVVSGGQRLICGFGWNTVYNNCKHNRSSQNPWNRNLNNVGFRLASSATE